MRISKTIGLSARLQAALCVFAAVALGAALEAPRSRNEQRPESVAAFALAGQPSTTHVNRGGHRAEHVTQRTGVESDCILVSAHGCVSDEGRMAAVVEYAWPRPVDAGRLQTGRSPPVAVSSPDIRSI